MTLVKNAPLTALQSLMLRAGASDSDRDQWLAERRRGISATEIRDLMLGAITDKQLADLKLGRRKDSFSGNAYTAWGNEREPVIAEHLRTAFDIAPESRVFHAADDPRKLASPDGLGVEFDGTLLASEIKTAGPKYDLRPGSDDFKAKGYGDQALWVLRVTGAARALFAWECRLGQPGAFECGELRTAWIERDEVRIAQLDARADQFLAVLDARALEPFEEPTVDDVVDTHAVNYLRFIELEKEAAAAKKAEYDAILEAVGEREDFRQEGLTARVTLTPMKAGTRLEVDADGARAARPDLWEAMVEAEALWAAHLAQYTVEVVTESRPRLTITTIKKGQGA